MAPVVGPSTALAMCIAAFVGWRVPSQPEETAKPEVPDPISADKPGDAEMHAVLSIINISSNFCESTTWQHWDATLQTVSARVLGFSDKKFGDRAMTHVWESGKGAMELAHASTSMLRNISILVDNNRSQSMQWSNEHSPFSGVDHLDSFFNSDSKNVSINFHHEGFSALQNGSGFAEGACPQVFPCLVPSESVNKSEPGRIPVLSAESTTDFHDKELGSLTEVAVLETEAVPEVPPPSCNVLDTHAGHETATLLPLDAGGLVHDITAMSSITPTPQVKQKALKGWNAEGHNQSSSFQGMLDEFSEFLLWSWQVCCTECRKMLSGNMLDKASEVLRHWWHACLASSRSVLGEDLFIRVSEVVVRWWQVALLCFASLCDVVLFGVFGRFLFRKVASFCCCGRRREPVSAEFGVADTKKKIGHGEKQNLPSDEPKELAQTISGTLHVLAPMFGDIQCDLACERGSVESTLKGQSSPFNSAIQVRSIPTPARRATGHIGFASSQHMADNSVGQQILRSA